MQYMTEKRSSASALLMTNLVKKEGISCEVCLSDTGISEADLVDNKGQILSSQELKLIENLVDAQKNDKLALEIGFHYHLTTYGIWGFAISTSPTVLSAIEVGLSYLPLTFAFSKITLSQKGELAYLNVDGSHLPQKVRRFVVERDMSAMVNIHRELFSNMMPIHDVHLQWQTADIELYQNILNKIPKFKQAQNCVIFDRALLDIPLPTANESSRQMLIAQCQDLLQQRHSEGGVALKVRNHILGGIDQGINMESIAKKMCVSLRTLRRQLNSENTSFRMLTDEVRESLALELIQGTSLSMEQISYRLGYSDTANFFHAFKRWKGKPPNHFRRR